MSKFVLVRKNRRQQSTPDAPTRIKNLAEWRRAMKARKVREEMPATVYSAVASRRVAFDQMFWQVPALSFTAQAFLLSTALAGDTSSVARVISSSVSIVISMLSVHLMVRNRQADSTDGAELARMEAAAGIPAQHGRGWAERRNETAVSNSAFLTKLVIRAYPLWLWVMAGMAGVGILIIVLSLIAPDLLQTNQT